MTIDRYRILCGKGYLPKELPPVFVSRDFGQHARALLTEWSATGQIPTQYHKFSELKGVKSTDPELYSVPKGGRERRFFHITHPAPQALLSLIIATNWKEISTWLRRAKYSFGPLRIVANADRAVADIEFAKHQVHKELIESYSNWIVKSDITRFYPSIYTHSIPWAAYGKENVKKNIKKYLGTLADGIDILLRKCNRDQTVGIPIGPDTSRIVSEIVSAYVDQQIFETSKLSISDADRLQDDWLVGSPSLERAEFLLSKIQQAYQRLGLDINGNKTTIEHLQSVRHPPWRGVVRSFFKGSGANPVGSDLHDLCRTALSLQAEHPRDFVLRYLISSLLSIRIRKEDFHIVEAFLLKAVVVDSRVTQDVCGLLLNYVAEEMPVNIGRVCARFVPFVESSLEKQHHFEALWGLFLIRGLKKRLVTKKIVELAGECGGAVLPLILLDMDARGLTPRLPKANWEKTLKTSDLLDASWLLAYEGVRHGWLHDASGTISAHPLLKPMFDRQIVFYDDRRNSPLRKVLLRRKREKHRHIKHILRLYIADYP
jgi:hypothetical protein